MKIKNTLCILAMLAALPAFPQADVQKIGQWLVLGPAEVFANGEALPTAEDAVLEYDFLSPSLLRAPGGPEGTVGHPAAAGLAGGRRLISAVQSGNRLSTWPFTWRANAGCRPIWLIEAAFPVRVYLDGIAAAPDRLRGERCGRKKLPVDPGQRQAPVAGQGNFAFPEGRRGRGQELCAAGQPEKQNGLRCRPRRAFFDGRPPHQHGRRSEHGEHRRRVPGPGRKPGGRGLEPASKRGKLQPPLARDPGYGKRRSGLHFTGPGQSRQFPVAEEFPQFFLQPRRKRPHRPVRVRPGCPCLPDHPGRDQKLCLLLVGGRQYVPGLRHPG